MQNNYLLLVPMIFPIIMALLTLSIKSKFADRAFREKYVGITLLINLVLVVMVLMQGGRLTLFEITERLPIIFKVDEMTMVFTSLVSVMWLLAGIFSFEYMKHENNN